MHEELISEFELTSKALLESVSDLSEAQAKHKVNLHVWSIHECLEHIVITEIAVYRILMQPPASEPSFSTVTERIGKEKIKNVLSDRSIKREAPDDVKPIGRFSSLDELREKFISNRKRIIDALKEGKVVFDNRIIVHPVLGEMTKKDWLNFLIHHSERHCKQIEELKSIVQLQLL